MAIRIFLTIFLSTPLILAFNISPQPNKELNNPSSRSFFGYSLNLRKNYILIGAPKSNSSLSSQKHLDEPGMIYKCEFDGHCKMFIIDNEGNTLTANYPERKDYRLLGYSIDGHENENDKFIACAPKELTNNDKEHPDLFGACYVAKNTKNNGQDIYKVTTLRKPKTQNTILNIQYGYSECGFSTHISDEKYEFISGCPGYYNWRGSIIQFSFETFERFNRTSMYSGAYAATGSSVNVYSYFGFAVTAGKFLAPHNNKMFYVASAPRSDYIGSVYIFSQVNINHFKSDLMFNGDNYGSYFGYALLSDDFNDDGKPDLVVSAPFYSEKGLYDNGAVYIYMNQATDGKNPSFKQPILLKPPYEESSSRFGMALGKIGDINLDGFNDLAISGTSKGKGVIYIYHGSINGLTLKQKIELAKPSSMFGFSISRGVDIDDNNYKDFAVSDPGSEKVYIFQTYPVIHIDLTLKASKNQIEINDKVIISACAKYTSKKFLNLTVQLKSRLFIASPTSLKNEHNNFTFSQYLTMNILDCMNQTFDINLSPSDVLKLEPVVFKYEFDLVSSISKHSKAFRNDCVAIDELEKKKLSLPLNLGCASEICKPNLHLSGVLKGVEDRLTIGTVRNVSISYEVLNHGERAYATRLSVSIPHTVKFISYPRLCSPDSMLYSNKILCNIRSSQPLKQNETFILDAIILDVSRVQGNILNITANVSSAGIEVNEQDNKHSIEIILEQHSIIDVQSQSPTRNVDIKSDKINPIQERNVQYTYKILNNGPSPMENFDFKILAPQYYYKNDNETIEIIQMESIKCSYKNEYFDIDWKIVERVSTLKNNDTKDEKFLQFSKKQTILLDCDQDYVQCLSVEAKIPYFEYSSEDFIKVELNFNFSTKDIGEILNEEKFRMLFRTSFLTRQINETLKSVRVVEKDFAIEIQKEIIKTTPWWIYIISTLGGLLLLVIMTYSMHRLGFFRRKIKQELIQKKRETMMAIDLSNQIQDFKSADNLT